MLLMLKWKFCHAILWIFVVVNLFRQTSSANVHVAGWDFNEVKDFFIISLFVLCLLIVKFIHFKVHWINAFIPESFILLAVGTIFGLIFRFATNSQIQFTMNPNLFFLILLPPIVLNSAYEMTTRSFYRVFGICIMYAVLGTVFNFLLIGFTLYGVTTGGVPLYGAPELNLTLRPILLFSSLIVAVDPVAVLAIFNDIGVEQELYFIVFGESLLNDAVTVVLYDIMKAFLGTEPISSLQIGLGIISFFTVSLGGLLIGLIFGIITCLVTRIYDNKFEVASIILLAYISYILADTIMWSGIIAIIGCGIVQAEYTFNNISPESLIILRNVVEMWANLSEGVIFLFLGESLSHIERGWHSGFVFWSLFICILARAAVCGILALVNNLVNLEDRKISMTELIIIVYGGLRGAVAYCLAALIDARKLDGTTGADKAFNRELIITTTLFIILFTIGVHGLTMKPLVKLLKIKIAKVEDLSLFKTTNVYLIDTALSGIEGISGDIGQNIIREKIMRFNNNYLRKFLQRRSAAYDDSLMKVIDKMSLAMHYAIVKPNESDEYLHEIPERLRYNQSMNFYPFFIGHDEKNKNEDLNNPNESSVSITTPNVPHTSFIEALAKTRRRSRIASDTASNHHGYLKEMKKVLHQKHKTITERYGSIQSESLHNDSQINETVL